MSWAMLIFSVIWLTMTTAGLSAYGGVYYELTTGAWDVYSSVHSNRISGCRCAALCDAQSPLCIGFITNITSKKCHLLHEVAQEHIRKMFILKSFTISVPTSEGTTSTRAEPTTEMGTTTGITTTTEFVPSTKATTTTGAEPTTMMATTTCAPPVLTPLGSPPSLFSMLNVNGWMSSVGYMKALPDGGAVVAHVSGGVYGLYLTDSAGVADPSPIHTMNKYFSVLIVQGGDVLAGHADGEINTINMATQNLVDSFTLPFEGFKDGLLLEPDSLLCVSDSSGRVYSYNILSTVTKTKAKGLSQPRALALSTSCSITLYAVVEKSADRVKVFDANWDLVTSMGSTGSGAGQLDLPLGVIVSPDNKIWVSDFNNKRVVEFTWAGQFVRYVLTQADGIGKTNSAAYHPDHAQYLWVSYQQTSGSYNTRKFKIF